MKKSFRVLLIIMIILILLAFFIHPTIATTINDFNSTSAPATDIFKKPGKAIVSILTSIGIVASVIVLAVIGIKYMLGSIEEKAEYKKSMMPYLIGAGLIFSASTVANIIYKFIS